MLLMLDIVDVVEDIVGIVTIIITTTENKNFDGEEDINNRGVGSMLLPRSSEVE